VDFDEIDQLVIKYSASSGIREKCEYNGRVRQLIIDFEKEGSIVQYPH